MNVPGELVLLIQWEGVAVIIGNRNVIFVQHELVHGHIIVRITAFATLIRDLCANNKLERLRVHREVVKLKACDESAK